MRKRLFFILLFILIGVTILFLFLNSSKDRLGSLDLSEADSINIVAGEKITLNAKERNFILQTLEDIGNTEEVEGIENAFTNTPYIELLQNEKTIGRIRLNIAMHETYPYLQLERINKNQVKYFIIEQHELNRFILEKLK